MKKYADSIRSKTFIKPNIILEIGSRDGDDANILKEEFSIKNSNVWVVEPNPKQQQKIKKKYPEFNLIKEAVFNENKVLTFNAVNTEDLIGVSSLLERRDNLYNNIDCDKINVQTIKGEEIIKIINSEIDLCKIDVEGVTYEVLLSFDDSILQIKSMHLENEHLEVWKNQKLYDDVKKYLISKGFTEIYFEYVNNVVLQSDSVWVQSKYLKNI
jgi:FkbM family methyltransferase